MRREKRERKAGSARNVDANDVSDMRWRWPWKQEESKRWMRKEYEHGGNENRSGLNVETRTVRRGSEGGREGQGFREGKP